jgi:hypothetical protein
MKRTKKTNAASPMPKFEQGHVITQKHFDFLIKKLGLKRVSNSKISLSARRNFEVGNPVSEAGAKSLNKAYSELSRSWSWIPGSCPYPPIPSCLHCAEAMDPFGQIWHACA